MTEPSDTIELAGLTKSFGPVQAVRGVDLTIPRGQTLALLGPNGAGKSTTLDMVLGLLRPDDGTVSVFGRPPGRAVAEGAIGGMLQVGSLIRDLSVRELVTLVASLYPDPLPVEEALGLAGVVDVADRRTNKLSGGQAQRARFAVSIVSNPELLVLDEPTVAMDVESRHEFWVAMRNFAARGTTVVFATHYLEEADASADRVVLMAGGRVVADGSSTEIKARVGIRSIRAVLPGVPVEQLSALPAVATADRKGDAVTLTSTDSDTALRAFLRSFPEARDIEVTGAGLEEAFLELTAPGEQEVAS